MKVPMNSVILMALLCLRMAACASPHESSESKRERSIEEAAASLEGKSDADSLAAAALLLQRNPARTLELLARATTLAPQRPDLAWLHTQACGKVSGCDSQAEAERLRILDPGNGAAWLPAVAVAEKAHDDAMQLSALSALARADHVDLYWTTLIVHLTRAVIATGDISSRDALTEMIGVLAVATIPAYRTVSQLCSGTRLDDRATLEDCRAAAWALQRGDTVITEMEGAHIAQRLWSEDSPQWLAASEARHTYEYRAAQLAHSSHNAFADNRVADDFLALCAHNHREQDVWIAELVADGKRPLPPAIGAP
jgi:hypothetical protein